MPGPAWTLRLLFNLPTELGSQEYTTTSSIYWLRWGSHGLFVQAPDLHVPSSQDGKHEPLSPEGNIRGAKKKS
jgi:hypothetical protein